MSLNENDIVRRCQLGPAEAGRRSQSEARVVEFARDGNVIRSAVQGDQAPPYSQVITLTERCGAVEIAGRCSCPLQLDCEHIAASLFQAIEVASANESMGVRIPASIGKRVVGAVDVRTKTSKADVLGLGLPDVVKAWVDDLVKSASLSSGSGSAEVAPRLVYLLMPIRDDDRMPQLGLQPVLMQPRQDGGLASSGRPHAVGTTFLRPLDDLIRQGLNSLPTVRTIALSRLTGKVGAEVLALVLATGRVHWLALDGPGLSAGQPRRGSLFWEEAEPGRFMSRVTLDRKGVVLAATPPVYVDPDAGLVGPVETDQPARIAAALLRAPPVAATALAALNDQLIRRAPTLVGLTPPVPVFERRRGVKPVPCLRLFTALLPSMGENASHRFDEAYAVDPAARKPVALARLSFQYGDVATRSDETKRVVTLYAGGRLIEIQRDLAAEAEAARLLLSHMFRPISDIRLGVPADHARDLVPGEGRADWLAALDRALPEVRNAGWDVAIAPDFPYRMLRADGPYDAELRESSGIDWLELHLGVTVDGERVDLIEPLVALISSYGFSPGPFDAPDGEHGETMFLPLMDDRVLAVPLVRLRPMVEAMRELAFGLDSAAGALRLSTLDAARLADFEAATGGAELRWRGGEALRDLGRKLTAAGGIPPVTVPPDFRAALRPYQAEGVAWLSLLREVKLGGILADDMGLGKTVQVLAFLAIEKAGGRLDRPALVVAPTSLVSNWAREAERFAPSLRVLTLQGSDRKVRFDHMSDQDLVLTTYPLVARDQAMLGKQEWHVLLLDEAQTIKNPHAATTKLILSLGARHRFCLTGTPLENNLVEFWSLFSFACPGLLGDRKRFASTWRTPIEMNGDAERGRLLSRRVQPFLLRRTKEEVARDLPPKTEMVERIALEARQRDIYESIRLSMHARIRQAIAEKGWARSRIVVLDALLKLRQACCDPRLLKLTGKSAAAAGSAKLERLEEMLRELLAEGHRVIVFSQFTSMLDLIGPRLDAVGIRYSLLTGSTDDRPGAIAAFDDGVAPVFLISLKAGGVGLNLVSADTVVLYDPWWNPAVEAQAIDRAHRIGQINPVFVHRLIAVDTIEEKMEVLKDRKAALAASLFDPDGEPTLAMTEADIEMLLAP